MSRASETLSNIPPATLAIIAICCAVYLYQFLFEPPLHHYTMNPRLVVHLNEYYRFVTSSLFHGGLMHLGMNMLSTAAISSLLEKRFGTLRQSITILWGILLTSAVYTVIAALSRVILGIDNLMYSHSVGFSGVIFHLSVLESSLNPNRTSSVFGFIAVPSHLYPWALLVVLQFVMPHVSFVGHLSGIVTGTMQLYGLLDGIMVGDVFLMRMESWSVLRSVTARSNFVKAPAVEAGVQIRRDPAALRGAVGRACTSLWTYLRYVLETLKVVIFGRGRDANENVHFLWSAGGEHRATSSSADVEMEPLGMGEGPDLDDDDGWVGLPPAPASNVESRIV